jgi:hypothetical protein
MVLLRFSPLQEFGPRRESQGESLRDLKATGYTCGLGAMIVGLGVYSYHARELLASLLLFSVAFFFLGLVVLGLFLVWCAGVQVRIWTRPALRNAVAFSCRLAAHSRP